MNSVVAQRYAQALFSFVENQGELDKIYTELEFIHKIILQASDFQEFLKDPTLEETSQIMILKKIFMAKVDESVMRFLLLLVKKKRLNYLALICLKFAEIYKRHKNIMSVRIITKTELSKQQLSNISQHLKLKFRKEIEPHVFLDEDMIGGIKLQIEDQVLDFSIQSLLDKFKNNLVSV
ncbi:MAG: ATP synthase F1 subunit delta [Candidatus Omnitrophica bacterium]|nr:ATP synthase F1 subunit delta [Candidatus Omnitrophota bacterium]